MGQTLKSRPNAFLSALILISALALLAAMPGCGSKGHSGQLWLYGSSQTARLSGRVADLFQEAHSGVTVADDGPAISSWDIFCSDTFDHVEGGGFATFDHQIPDGVAAGCESMGIEWVELPVAVESIAAITGEDNPLDCVSIADIYALVSRGTIGFDVWADAQAVASELGSTSVLPEVPLAVFGPAKGSPTHKFFYESMEQFAGQQVVPGTVQIVFLAKSDNDSVLDEVRSSRTGLGWVNYSTAANVEDIKVLEVDGGNGCVAPTRDSIATGRYPIARTIYLYVAKAQVVTQPHVTAFVDFYLTDKGLEAAVGDVGYTSLTEEAKAATRATWADR